MKKLLTLIIAGTASFGFAQSFSLYKTNAGGAITHTVTNGYTIVETSTGGGQTNTKIRIKNNAATTQTFNVVRTVLSQNPALDLSVTPSNPTTYFCFGYSCFTSNVNTAGPGDYTILLPAGQTSTNFPSSDNSDANAQPFSIYLDEGATVGLYAVYYKVFVTNNTNDSIGFTVNYNIPAGIKNNAGEVAHFDIFPNPAASESVIRLNAIKSSEASVIVTNIAGQTIYTKKHQVNPGSNLLSINCEGMPSGVYSVSLKTESGLTSRKLVITK
ncbi:MAG: Secretion system C-terminal sorting domain [Bacteroidetes bacterium]|jgi:hypothetical protein|nr:Secretion system C-terminal sorting domain [Bacteroidota bacterium]